LRHAQLKAWITPGARPPCDVESLPALAMSFVAPRSLGGDGESFPLTPRPLLRPVTGIVALGPITRADGHGLLERVRGLAREGGVEEIVCDVRAVAADVVAVEALVGAALTARRLGSRLRLRGASPELADLLALCGLTEPLLAAGGGRGLEAQGQAEEGEPPRGVEERDEPRDAPP
jgi:anti-anti-sigma regulatory factor